jgi:hypothetical protein
MVWSKIATLQTSYSYEEIYNGYNTATSRNWHMQQMDWIADLLVSECGFTKTPHPNYSNTSTRRAYVLETNKFTDITSGALTSWAFWMYFNNSNFSSTGYDPYRYEMQEIGYNGSTPEAPGTSSNYRCRNYYATDGGDRYATGVITAWQSSLDPSSLLVLTGNPYQIFYWPGAQQAYRPYASDPEPWKYQGAMMPWGQYGMASAGNPTGEQSSSYYGSNGIPRAFIDSYRGSTGAGADRADPGQTANGALLYQDYWMVHGNTYQPIYKASRDCAIYRTGPTSGGLPAWSGQSNSNYKYYRPVTTYQVDSDYWLGNNHAFWFNAGPTLPEFGQSPWLA